MLASQVQTCILNRELELRHLPHNVQRDLTNLLDCSNCWKDVMARVRKEAPANNALPYKYTQINIMTIQKAAVQQHRSCTEIFLEEWGTSGRRRPTLGSLLELLTEAQLFRAADYVAELLGEEHPSRPSGTPAAPIDIPDLEALMMENTRLSSQNQAAVENDVLNDIVGPAAETIQENNVPPPPIVPPETGVLAYPFRLLNIWTDNFNSDTLVDTPGGRIKRQLGSGGFGSVFLAKLPDGEFVAVKKLHGVGVVPITPDQFVNEVTVISQIRHPNLLSLVGYSNDGPDCCLLYEYVDGGNLQVRLGNQENPLPWFERVKIADCVANGLDYMQNCPGGPYIHRDVKSANILLSSAGDVKLGDFGLVRWGSPGDTTRITSNVVGSTPYMAPEAFRGDVSIKMDTFSFGVVLSELLTALSPLDNKRPNADLVSHMQTHWDNIESILDISAGDWPDVAVFNLLQIIKDCFNDKLSRPTMTEIKLRISSIFQ